MNPADNNKQEIMFPTYTVAKEAVPNPSSAFIEL